MALDAAGIGSRHESNGERYSLVISTGSIRRGGMRSSRFDGTGLSQKNCPKTREEHIFLRRLAR